MAEPLYAISIKQPWATLLITGRKQIEIRTWSTLRRGPVLIHAGRHADDRPEAWEPIMPDIRPLTRLTGGIIGRADLVECRTYADATAFASDTALHLNAPEWFVTGPMYGFVFAEMRVIPFKRLPGNLRFFTVDPEVIA